MTALRLSILSLLSLFLAAIGAILWFDPMPASALVRPNVSSAVLASSVSVGGGLFAAQLAMAIPAVAPREDGAPPLVAIAVKPTRTRTATPTLIPTDAPTPTPGPTDAPTVSRPTVPPTATRTLGPSPTLGPTNTRAPTRTPAPSSTPAPTRAPVVPMLSGCGEINQSGTYTLAGPLSSGGDCLNIRANNVTLDCRGQSITGQGMNGYGVAVRLVGLIPARANNIEIRGCRISGFRYGIYVEGSANAYLHDNNVSGNFTDVDGRRYGIFLGMAEGGGIRLNNSVGARVEANTANDGAIGIDARQSANLKIRANTASNNTAWGINLYNTSNSEVSGNTTVGNIRYCTWGAGDVGPGCDAGGIIMQMGSSNNLIANNQVLGGNGNGIFIKAHAMPCGNNNIISGNTIDGALYNSIEMGFCSGTQILNNQLNNALDGIWFGFATGTTIKNNTITNHRNHGIIGNHVRDNLITGNNLNSDNEALYLYWEPVDRGVFGWFNPDDYPTTGNTISGNTLSNNIGSGIHLKDGQNNQFTGNTLTNNARNWWFEGNTKGNVISGNNPDAWLSPERWLALLMR